MSTRRQAREAAFQYLFSALPEAKPQSPTVAANFSRESFEQFCRNFGADADEFAWQTVETTGKNLPEIDAKIASLSAHWRLERMPRVDLTILRLCCSELIFRDDIPKSMAINEAVELAKRFGAEESPSFVNGLLDKVKK